jgi:lipid-binding SYLF domain-containing protein
MRKALLFVLSTMVCFGPVLPAAAQPGANEAQKVTTATAILTEIINIPEGGIPDWLLKNSYGIAIFPSLIKAGFIVGARYGTGILVVRNDRGEWSNPVFFKLMGGGVGWQIGAQSSDIVLIFRTIRSLDAITSGKFTLGADAAVAAGPVGRNAEAGTDILLRSEIYSYSRSRGLFAGISLEGASLQVDFDANSAFYNMAGLLPVEIFSRKDLQAPYVAEDLRRVLNQYTK